MKKTIVVNLFGGPGTAKSIFCALIFARLKLNGINCEMAREFAKDMIWEGSEHILENQQRVYSEQQRRLYSLNGKVDVVITDAPLLNSLIYDRVNNGEDIDFHRTIINEFNRYDNRNYVLNRVVSYEQEGRYQDEAGAREIDEIVLKTLDGGFSYMMLDAWEENANVIARDILKELKLC
jgi:hypothetical protein